MKKLVVSMFILVTASFFFVCGVSATRFDGYYQYGTVTSTVADSVFYNDLSVSAGTESYFDVSFTFGQVTYYNSTMQQITVGSATYSTNIGILEVSCSNPNIDISFDESNRIHCFFQNDFSGDLQFSIKYYIRNTFTGGSPNNATMQNITMRRAVTTHYGSMMHSFNGSPSLGVINDKLNQILDALGSSGFGDYLGEDALFYFDKRYFNNGWVGSSVAANSNGYFVVESTGTSLGFALDGGLSSDTVKLVQLTKGSYVFSFSGYFESAPSTVTCNGVTISDILVRQDFANTSHYFISGVFTFDVDYFGRDITFGFDANLSPGIVWGGIARAPDDYLAGSAMNPEQSGLVSDVDNAGQQQQQQEDQLWANINSYKGDLTFNLDDWSEAAGGLSYVSGIFMSIWNNSPTQIIILSLMLGIAMLSIGRGVQAAVRVSRRRDDG